MFSNSDRWGVLLSEVLIVHISAVAGTSDRDVPFPGIHNRRRPMVFCLGIFLLSGRVQCIHPGMMNVTLLWGMLLCYKWNWPTLLSLIAVTPCSSVCTINVMIGGSTEPMTKLMWQIVCCGCWVYGFVCWLQLKAIVVDCSLKVVHESSVAFDSELGEFG